MGVSLNAEVFARFPGDPRKPIYAIKLNCRREWPSVESTFGPIALRLRTDDPDLVVFNRLEATSWKDISWWGWMSLGRKDIFISHEPPREIGTTAKDSCIRFKCTPSIQLSAVKWTRQDNRAGAPTKRFGPEYYHLTRDRGIMYMELTFDYLRRVDKTYWIVMKPGPALPLFGIWELAKDADVQSAIGRIEKTAECTTMFPGSVRTSPGRSIELAMRPISPPSPTAPKTYLVDVRFVDEERYIGKMGRFVPFAPFAPFVPFASFQPAT